MHYPGAMKTLTCLWLVVCFMALTGCEYYSRWQRTQAQADLTHEQSEILKAYRECLAEYRGKPELAKQNCEHYTQALTVLDVRVK